jgi:hypothetical protein
MEQPIAVFEPIRSGNYNIVMISLFFVGIAVAFFIYNLKKDVSYKQKGYKQLFSLLAFFVIIIAATTAFFSYWAALKLTPVKVFSESIETSFGNVDLEDIQNIYILNDQQLAPLSGNPKGDVVRFLIIEEVDRKTHALSEENYDIDSLVQVLNTLKK